MALLASIDGSIWSRIGTLLIRIFGLDLGLSLFVSIESVIGVTFHVCLSDRSDFRDVEKLFAAFQGLHVSLTIRTLFASLVEKVEILIC